MSQTAAAIVEPVASLVALILVSFLFFFGPLRRVLSRRSIQPDYQGSTTRLFWHDFVFTLLNLSLVITATVLLLEWLFRNSFITAIDSPSIATTVGQFVLYFFAFDLYYFSFHRLLHTPFLYKHVHSHHHRSTRPTPLTSYAVHPFEGFMSFMFTLVLFLFMDMSIAAFFAMNAYSVVHAVVLHSGHDFFPRWWYRTRIAKGYVTPVFHDMHHSSPEGVNYGIYTTIWDRLFGTISPSLQTSFDEVTHAGEAASQNG